MSHEDGGTVSFGELAPYAHAAERYFELGWWPLPVSGKGTSGGPPRGFTGRKGVSPSADNIAYWVQDRGEDNVCLRLSDGIIGVDVDAYGEKKGRETLAQLENERGSLPLTWVTGSRDDGCSGIRLFRVPEGWEAPAAFGPDIQGVWQGYRYAVAWPSRHPETGRQYKWRWQKTYDVWIACDPPAVSNLPLLPESWLVNWPKGLSAASGGVTSTSGGENHVDIEEMIRSGAGPSGGQRPELLRLTQKLAGLGRSEAEALLIWRAVVAATPQDPRDPWTDNYFYDFFRSGQARAESSALVRDVPKLPSGMLTAWAARVQVTERDNTSTVPVEEQEDHSKPSDVTARQPILQLAEDEISALLIPGMGEWQGGGDDGALEVNLGETREKLPRSDVEAASFLASFLNGELLWSPVAGHWRWWDGIVFRYDGDSHADSVTRAFALAYKDIMRIVQETQVRFLLMLPDFERGAEARERERAARERYQVLWGKHRAYRDRLFSHAGQVSLANALKSCTSREEQLFDNMPGTLACDNGIITFTSHGDARLTAHSPEWLVTKRLANGAEFAREQESSALNHFLETSVRDAEQREFLQTVVGAAFTGYPWKGLLVFLGEGDSGKSTFASFLVNLLGGFATTIDVEALAGTAPGNNEFRLANLRGRALAVASEPAKGDRVNASVIKSITGGDEQTTRMPYAKAPVTWKPRCLLLIVTNHSVSFETTDEAMMRRLGIIRFTRPPVMDESLPYRLAAEMPGALSWALTGAEKWLRAKKRVTVPTSVLSAREDMADETDNCLSFITALVADEIIAVELGAPAVQCVRTGDLFQHYRFWCQQENVRQVGGKTFSQRIGRRYPVVRSDGSRFSGLVQVSAFLHIPSLH